MQRIFVGLGLVCFVAVVAAPQSSSNPFLGRWDFNVQTSSGTRANWISVAARAGKLGVWFHRTGGNVHTVEDGRIDADPLGFTAAPATARLPSMNWDLSAS